MKKSTSEQSNRFKLEVMLPLEVYDKNLPKKYGRTSLSSIPPINPSIIYNQRREVQEKSENEIESESLGDKLCNSYKFVVNYGVFEPNFEWLPEEVLIRIFDYLSTRDLLTTAMVCQRWMEALQYFRLNRKILLHFQIFKYSDTAYPMNRFLNCSRLFPNIKFSIVKFTPKNHEYWTEYGDVVEELTFNSCLINKPEFLHIIRLCPNLKMLSITRCEDLYKSWSVVKKLSQVRMKFQHLKTLSIYETSLMTKSVFNFLVTSAPNLTSLTLANCFKQAKPKDRVQVLDSLADFVATQSDKIKALNLVNTHTDELFLLKLAEIKNLHLHELRFTFNGVVATTGKSGVVSLIRSQTDLRILDVTESKGLSNYCLWEICRNMKYLQKLILNKCWLINDAGLKEINRLVHLELLDVSCCDRLTDLGLLDGLVPHGKKFTKMKELYLGLLPYMSITAIYRLAQQYDQLEVLDLSGSSNSITDEALQMICRYQVKLKYLNLDCCAKITDFGLTGLTDVCEHGNFKSYVQYNLNKLEDLRYLNLGGCYHITDKSFINVFDLCYLKEINLSRCHNITEIGLKQLCNKCPLLKSVDLSECFNVTDKIVKLITKDIVRLETLKLSGCKQITDEILTDIAVNCKYLKSLYIRRCPKIQTNPFEVLKDVRYIYNQ